MKSFKKYLWLFEWISASLVLAAGFVLCFVDGLVLFATGFALILIGALRFIPLLKTTKDNLMKLINSIEIVVNILIGVIMISLSIKTLNEDFNIQNGYSYMLGGVLVLRAGVFFFGTSIRKEETDIVKFFVTLVLFALGTYLVYVPGNEKVIGYFILVIAILCAIYLIVNGIKNYNRYRHEYSVETEMKKVSKKKEDSKELPGEVKKDDEIHDGDVSENIIEEPINDKPTLNA